MKTFPNRFSLNHLIERPWIFSGLGIRWYEQIFGKIYRQIYSSELSKHGLDIDPFNLYWINPDRVSKRTGRHQYTPRDDIGTVRGGSWDRNVNEWRQENHPDHIKNLYVSENLEESSHYRSMESHFIEGIPWRETKLYSIVMDRINDGHSFYHGCSSEAELRARLRYVDDLYRSIQRDGYKTQIEIIREGGCTRIADLPDIYANEITLDVG